MSGELLLGIDIGTYGSKGVLCTPDGEIVAERALEHGLSVPRAGWAEHDADAVWWGDFCALARGLLEGVSSEAIAAVGVSGLGPDLVPLDAAGAALRPAILYGVDGRASEEIAELERRFGRDALAGLGGMYLTSQAVGPKILWLRRREPEVFARTRYLCTSSTFLVLRLTGEYVLDPHTASLFSPLFDMALLTWSDRCRDAVSGEVPLPELAWPGDAAGAVTARAAEQTGLEAGTPVMAGTIDAISEAVSVGVTQPGDLMMMYGTTAFLVLVVDRLGPPDRTVWQTPYAFPGSFDIEAGMATTGALMRWFRDNFAREELAAERSGGPNAYAALLAEAERVPAGSEGLVVLPYFSGERTPLNDPQARGIIAGLALRHGRGHVYRAILEAVGYGLAHNLESMRALGAAPKRAVAVGGGAQNPLLLQIVSDVTGVDQELPERTLGACYGDAFLAGRAAGLVAMSDLGSGWVRIGRRIRAQAERRSLYREYFGIYRRLYEETKEDMHSLAGLSGAVKEP